jgi:recombination protein RecA
MYNEGISREGSIIDVAIAQGLMQKQGAWFSYGDTKLGQGREGTIGYLKQNPKLVSEVEKKLRELAAAKENI